MNESAGTVRNLVVIGAGPAGYPAAFYAADLGMRVTLVDAETAPGGVCLHRGCIPSKALLHAARVLEEAGEARAIGIEFGKPEIRIERLREWKNGVVGKLTGGLESLRKQRKVDRIRGRAEFTGESSIRIQLAEGGTRDLSFDLAILATGSRPATIPGLPDHPGILDSTGALALETIPPKFLVIGGGYIGLELGSVYSALGSAVTVVEMLDGLLPGADRALVEPLARRLKKRFASIHLKTRVAGVTGAGAGLRVAMENEEKGRWEETFDRVLVSVGRRPNSDNLGLDRAGIEIDRKGFVTVDSQRRTSNPRVYAIGDLAGEPMLAHKATHEARVAVEAIAGRKTRYEPRAIPAVVFTDPEIAWAGLTESEAVRDGRAVRVARFPWAASGRAMTLDRTEGVTQLIIEPDTERVLGVGMCGPGAGEMISEGVLAIEMGAVVSDLAWTIHPHPTLSETVMEAAEAFFGHCTHLPPSRS